MNFALKLLYQEGEALTTKQFSDSPSYVGYLIRENWPSTHTARPTVRRVRFLDMALLDPMIVGLVDGKITLYGYEMHEGADTENSGRHIQCWELSPIRAS